MVCAVRNFENVDEDNIEEWLWSDGCELGFQHVTDADIAHAAHETKGRNRVWGG
jgi:hypothetical protein